MDIKPVPVTHPPAPVLKDAAHKDTRREQSGAQHAKQAPPPAPESSDGDAHIDAYA